MPLEIERKFIARAGELPPPEISTRLCQGYIDRERATVRVRLSGDACFLTIKGAVSGMSRLEYEFPIPLEQGRELLEQLCRRPLIDKTRHLVAHGGRRWEVDVFHGENDGLVVAEIELDDEDETVDLPSWVGREVTSQARYANAALAERPYAEWSAEEKSHS